jgi:hypothetical protein
VIAVPQFVYDGFTLHVICEFCPNDRVVFVSFVSEVSFAFKAAQTHYPSIICWLIVIGIAA